MKEFQLLNATDPRTCLSGKIGRISRITGNIFRKHLKPFGISSSQMSLLFLLSKRDGLTQKEICDILYMEKSTLNRNLNRLLEKGQLSKARFPAIIITQQGKELLEKVIPSWQKAMQEIRELLGEDGEAAVYTTLTKLKQAKS